MPYIHGKSIIKIAIAEDQEMIRQLLTGFVNSLEHCKVIIQAANGRDLLEKLDQRPGTDLVLLDINMPEMNGYDAAKQIRQKFPDIKILFCSMFKNELAMCRMIGAGAHGFINKGASTAELTKAIIEIMRNGYCFPNSDGKMYYFNEDMGRKKLNKSHFLLSDTEIRFLELICTEKTYKEIATELNMSLRQVDYMREALFLRLDVQSRMGLAARAYCSGIPVSEVV